MKGDCSGCIRTDQIALDGSVEEAVRAHPADLNAITCRVDDVACARCAATNCDSGPLFDIDSSRQRADLCRSGGIGADIIALHCRVAAVV